jgi:bacillithiol system protein YtxJ
MDHNLTTLREVAELEKALDDSHRRPLLLFKHSYSCGVSAEALDELRAHLEDGAAGATSVRYAIVTVQTHRDLSNRIAERLGVRHETPQVILVHDGRAVWTASHFRVNTAEIEKALAAVYSRQGPTARA